MRAFPYVVGFVLMMLSIVGTIFYAIVMTGQAHNEGHVELLTLIVAYGTSLACTLGLISGFIKNRRVRLFGPIVAGAGCLIYGAFFVLPILYRANTLNMLHSGFATQLATQFAIPPVLGIVGACLMVLSVLRPLRAAAGQQDE